MTRATFETLGGPVPLEEVVHEVAEVLGVHLAAAPADVALERTLGVLRVVLTDHAGTEFLVTLERR